MTIIAILAAKAHRVAMLAVLALASLWPGLSAHAQSCTYDLGSDRITYGTLFATTDPGERLLGTRTTTLTVTCPTPRDMTLEYIDVMPDTVASSWALENAGRFNVRLSNVVVDGMPVDLAGNGGPEIQTMSATQTLSPDREVTPFSSGAPVQGTTLTAQIDVTAWLDAGLAVNDETTWSGHGRLRFATSGDEVPLEVEAMMAPASCHITVQDVVLSDTPRSAFHPTQSIPRPESIEYILDLSCSSPGLIGIAVTDNRSSSRYLIDGSPDTAARSFGFGMTSMGKQIGAYQIHVAGAYSGAPVGSVFAAGNNSTGWTALSAQNMFFTNTAGRYFTVVNPTTLVPQATHWMQIYYTIRPWLAPASVANITGPEALDGSATFTIVYL
ncbi:hypothetical protein LK996_06830 [Lysobacter sp. A6]|uniref:Fimbrial-type adhesion domain-containing protein n=1 Tax=Noviluteimonas lactosilytica TaxID=2888523 RepID=A0ABS8JGQ8_9GAMM|nr:hypothetical protein [Lysobacter lactosilyticus]MCC8362789.1 hypothetical protein [Lysobacter lactosilyticus]